MTTAHSDLPENQTLTENARAGYQAAVDLWTFSSAQGWERFNIMLTANSILIAAIGLTLNSESSEHPFTTVMPTLGFVLCLTWFLLIKRSFDYAEYYVLSAREIEEAHLSSSVTTVSRGGEFSEGEEVHFSFNDGKRSYRISWPARIMRGKTVSYIVIILFIIFYVIALGFS